MLKEQTSAAFKGAKQTVFGAVVALTAAIAPVSEALAKTTLPLNQYFAEAQRSGHAGRTHEQYSPYKPGENMIDVTLRSTKYGNIQAEFNCETTVPYLDNGGNVRMLLTEGAVSTVHGLLGARNDSDPEAMKALMRILSNSLEVVDRNNAEGMSALAHLNNSHGIAPNNFVPILEECHSRLNF